MTALFALFLRSLREDTRSVALISARVGIAAAVLFALLTASHLSQAGGAAGLAFFSKVVWMNFVVICGAGMSYFASAITEEKEEGTLGLLRMAGLSPWAILVGKGTGRMVGGLLLLLVQLPFAMLSITLGGVALRQVLGSYALLGAFLFLACNVALLGSVVSPRSAFAGVFALAVGWVYQAWPQALGGVFPGGGLGAMFSVPHALKDLLLPSNPRFSVMPTIWAMLLGGLLAFLLARVSFDRFCQDESERSRSSASGGLLGKLGGPFKARPGRAWEDAICWRDFYYLHGGPQVQVLKAILYFAGAIWLAVEVGRPGQGEVYFAALFWASAGMVTLESLFATSRIFRLERQARALSSLMILPGYYDAVIRAKRRAVILSLLPGLSVVGVSLLVLLLALSTFAGRGSPLAFVFLVFGLSYFVAQLYFNHYLVAWFSLRVKWGGLPLALITSWIGNLFAAFLGVLLFNLGAFLVLTIATAFAAAAMRTSFRNLLEKAAAEE